MATAGLARCTLDTLAGFSIRVVALDLAALDLGTLPRWRGVGALNPVKIRLRLSATVCRLPDVTAETTASLPIAGQAGGAGHFFGTFWQRRDSSWQCRYPRLNAHRSPP